MNRRFFTAVDVDFDERQQQVQQLHVREVVERTNRWFDTGAISLDDCLVVSRVATTAELDASAYWKSATSLGYCDVLQLNLSRSPARLAAIGFGRSREVGKYGDDEIALMLLLLPHLRRAVEISSVLEARVFGKSVLVGSLDVLNVDVIVTDEDCRVQHCNAAAEQRLRSGDGPFGVKHDRLVMREDAAHSEVAAAVRQSRRDADAIGKLGTAVRLTDDLRDPAVAHVMPLDGGEVRTRLTPATSAAIFVSRPVDDARCARAVADAFALTLAETRVLVPLLATKTTAEIATELRLSPDTVRSHIKSIFAKTGVSRQSELMQLAMSLVSPA